MKIKIYLAITLFIFVAFTSCESKTDQDVDELSYSNVTEELITEEDREEIKTIIDQKNTELEKLYREGKMEEAATYFSQDVIQLAPNTKPIKGTQMYIDEWNKAVSQGEWNFDFRVEEVKFYGNAAVELGSYDLEILPAGGSEMPPFKDQGYYVVLWEKIDGDWKIVWDAPVSSLPLPGQENEKEM
ncbi:nuclear transport factor 2 family protein [Mangrovivirga sp. M17]|uniref:Nuclear transport factor 2 family protein n=1 Tax=Mangrovivirga halotolerans TaxID=2993936 RepID=A0ABT3RM89_9BACT|nr:nuclear transport factor 2 family protein [Mangrovivirga halotolerans]MCX2742722.1 nuclear transport factor 2 family protein [Mangrovivirga halotolerans]